MSTTTRRTDIQVLRAIAVLLVLVYHAGANTIVPRGYLGVDVFFVISGFLMTRMIVTDIDSGTFSFARFYGRRARRLLPAAYATFAGTLLVAGAFLTRLEYRDYLIQLLGAVTFTANILLWRQTGYFDTSAEYKPLLHTWSLSVEEQFYFALPVLLLLLRPAYRLRGLLATFVMSLGLYLTMVGRDPDLAFYLLPTRAWELLVGGLLTVVSVRRSDRWLPRWTVGASLSTIVAVPVIPLHALPPGLDGVLVTVATAVLIAARSQTLQSTTPAKRLAIVGDWSYSLYLVHWPLFAFAASGYAAESIPPFVRIALFAASFPLAYLQFRFVERPTQVAPGRTLRPMLLGSSAALLLPIAIGLSSHATGPLDADVRRVNYGLDPACRYEGGSFVERAECQTSSTPTYALWGDSYAMHLATGLALDLPIIQMTQSACGPVLGVANIVTGTRYTEAWARNCISFNASVVDYISRHREIETVIVSSTFEFSGIGRQQLYDGTIAPLADAVLVERYAATIRTLRAAGKKVVLIAFPPTAGFDLGVCQERVDAKLVLLGRTSCGFTDSLYRARMGSQISFLERIGTVAAVTVLWPHDILCAGGVCRSQLNGKPVYRDAGHLSYDGSVEFARAFGLATRVSSSAR